MGVAGWVLASALLSLLGALLWSKLRTPQPKVVIQPPPLDVTIENEHFGRMESATMRTEREMYEELAKNQPPVEGSRLHLAPPGSRCEDCRFWDRENGRAVMQQTPHFAQVAQVISPNDMMRKVSRDGKNIVPPVNPLKAKVNDWNYFGSCDSDVSEEGGKLVHGHYGCSAFEAKVPS
jgi:hypothetical protein